MSRSRKRTKLRQSITGETCRQIAEARQAERAARGGGVVDKVKSVLKRMIGPNEMPKVGEGLVVGPDLIVGARTMRMTLEDFAQDEAQRMIERHHQVRLVAVFRFKGDKAPPPMPGPLPVMSNHWEDDAAGKFARLHVPLTNCVITEGFLEDLDPERRKLVEGRYPSAGVVTWHLVDIPAPEPEPERKEEPKTPSDTKPRSSSSVDFLLKMAEQQRTIEDAVMPRAMREIMDQQKRIKDALTPPAVREMMDQQKNLEDALVPRPFQELLDQKRELDDLVMPRPLREMLKEQKRVEQLIGAGLGRSPGMATLRKQLAHEPTERCFDVFADHISFGLLKPGGIERVRRAEESVTEYAREHGIPTDWHEVAAEVERGERVVTPTRAAVSDAIDRIQAVMYSFRQGRLQTRPLAKRLLTEEQHGEYERALGEIAHRIMVDEQRYQDDVSVASEAAVVD